jgi:hypothetical protein
MVGNSKTGAMSTIYLLNTRSASADIPAMICIAIPMSTRSRVKGGRVIFHIGVGLLVIIKLEDLDMEKIDCSQLHSVVIEDRSLNFKEVSPNLNSTFHRRQPGLAGGSNITRKPNRTSLH